MRYCTTYYQFVNKTNVYVAHGILAGVASEIRKEGSFWSGFSSGTVASFMTTTADVLTQNLSEAWQMSCMAAAGALSGGVSSTMAGGEFIDGVCNGLICSGLNHALHLTCETISWPDDPPGSGSANNNSNYINNGHLPPGNRIFR